MKSVHIRYRITEHLHSAPPTRITPSLAGRKLVRLLSVFLGVSDIFVLVLFLNHQNECLVQFLTARERSHRFAMWKKPQSKSTQENIKKKGAVRVRVGGQDAIVVRVTGL